MIWSLANLLSMARIAAVPVVVALIWPGIESRYTCFWAMVVYALAGITDMFDGMVARRTNTVTVLGKFLDPLSDKLFHLVVMVALLQFQVPRIPPWLLMVVLMRELTITGLRSIAMSEGIVIAAGEGGKVKTMFATAGMCALLLHYPYVINFGPFTALIDFHFIGLGLTYVSVAFSLTSAFGYLRGFYRAVKTHGGGAH